MKKYIIGITLIVLILSLEIIFYKHYRNNTKFKSPKRKAKQELVKKPFGKPLKKEPDAITNEWMAYQRCYPYDEIKLESYSTGMKTAMERHKQATNTRNNWELVGPTNIGGRITDIEILPENPNTIYVGAASGGIYKTENGGENWNNIFTQASVISIGDIVIDPQNPNILFAGTGEANASSYSFLGNGMYRTLDSGENWENVGLENSGYFGRIIVDYENSQRVFTAACGNLFSPNSERGIFRSDDGGDTWDRKLFVSDSTSAIDLVQHPENPDILYAGMWERMRGLNYRKSFGETSGIWKTIDGGENWYELTTGLPNGNHVGRIGLTISNSQPNILYAFYDNENEVEVYKTETGGMSWDRVNDSQIQGINSSFGWYFGQIRVDPNNSERIYVLGVELWRSDNGGSNWVLLADYGNTNEIHVDHHAMYINPITGRILEGNDGGFYLSDDNGDNWEKIDNIPLTQFYDIEIDHTNPERIYGGTQDNNTIRTTTGSLDDWHPILGGDGFYCLVDHSNPNIIFAEWQWGNLNKSTNGGFSFFSINYEMSWDRTNWSSPLVMDPVDSSILYFGTYRVWKTTNSGENWIPVSDDLTNGDDGSSYHTVTTLAISPLSTQIILAGTDDSKVHISLDAGDSWNDVSEGLPNRWITRVATDPFDVNCIYATVSGFRWDESYPHVLKSNDWGENWFDISSNLPEIPINCIVLDPNIYNRIFVGSDSGIFMTENGGESWESVSAGIPNVPITSMKIHNPTRTLVIGTYGCSAYKINLDDGFVSQNESSITKPIAELLQNFPNPFQLMDSKRGTTRINYSIQKPSLVNISIYDIKGRKIKTLVNQRKDAGEWFVNWDGMDKFNKPVANGIFLYRLKLDSKTVLVKKMQVIK
ncbi:MAG: hypothetical protein K8S23_06220 [Candidatus Cloacimonetes bacterium]|nr:hypothetical protein [Candidatus Cloacimonadota bacterium]